MTTKSPTIPFFAVAREATTHQQQYINALRQVLAHGRVLQGPEVQEFERRIAEACQRRFAIAVNSCTDALCFALIAAGVKEGDEVLVTDFTFLASASAILRIGARPVFVDIGPDFNFDLNDAQRRITPRCTALVCVHLFGQMCSPGAVRAFCRDNQLRLIEDGAQSFGASREGRRCGSLGDLSCLSFDPTKTVGAPGSGGVVLTDDPRLASKTRALRYHGKDESGEFTGLGYNSQMSTLSAAVLCWKLQCNEVWRERRRQIAVMYDENLPSDFIIHPQPVCGIHSHHKYVIRHAQRDRLAAFLKSRGVECGIHYATPLHATPVMRPWGGTDNDFPCAVSAAREVLSLPIHAFLTDEEVCRVIDTLDTFSRVHYRIAA